MACVCLNAINVIEDTIRSILEQTYSEVELIVVDGLSTDGTYELLCKYEREQKLVLIHEKDSGIYDAMNKAVGVAGGDYIYFLGAGDVFYDKYVLAELTKDLESYRQVEENALPVVLCGNFEAVYSAEKREIFDFFHHPNISGFRRSCGFPTSHQAFMVRCDVMKKKMFDTTYLFQADQEVLAYCLKHYRKSIHLVDILFSKVDANGFSAKASRKKMQAESDRINKEYNRFWYSLAFVPKFFWRKIFTA